MANQTHIEIPEGLTSIQDFVRWGASNFNMAGLYFGHGTDNALDDAVHLVLCALHLDPAQFPSVRQCSLSSSEKHRIVSLFDTRIRSRMPSAYLTERAWFANLEFYVTPDVLVPRSPIAELIESGFEPWVDSEQLERVLDLCTGSGCIGIATANYLPDVTVDLVDISSKALDVAQENVNRHGLQDRVHVIESDLFSALSGQRYDLIVSNPPYVPTPDYDALPAEFHQEPELGLVSGEDGLDIVLNILCQAADYLMPDGQLIVEVGLTADLLEEMLPNVAFSWVDFERGGEGVFILTREQLLEYEESFKALVALRDPNAFTETEYEVE